MSRNWRKAGGAEALIKGLRPGDGGLLFGGESAARDTVSLRVADILPNPDQPRRAFNHDDLTQLADSLRGVGQLAPILVKRHPAEPKRYLLVAGERRWRAARIAELPELSAHILEDDADPDRIALIENLQRVNLSPIEEAEGVQRLIERHGYNQEQAGGLLSRSRTEINTTLTLLKLDPLVRRECQERPGEISKALLLEIARMPPAEQRVAWEKARSGALTVREARAARRERVGGPARPAAGSPSPAKLVEAMARGLAGVERGVDGLEDSPATLSLDTREALLALRRRLEDSVQRIDRLLTDAP